MLNPPSYGKPEIKRGDRIFRLGDKVIQTKNNRDIGIFNGDVGYIKRIDTAEDEIIISFNGSDVTIDSTQLADLDLAYAISIHKAQGSEYNQIIIPIITGVFHHAQAQSDLHRHHQSKEKGSSCRSQTRAGTGDPDERHRQTQHAAWQKNYRKYQ